MAARSADVWVLEQLPFSLWDLGKLPGGRPVRGSRFTYASADGKIVAYGLVLSASAKDETAMAAITQSKRKARDLARRLGPYKNPEGKPPRAA